MAVAGAAKRYGQAAFDVAKEHNAIEQWERDLTLLSEVLSDPEIAAYVSSPAVHEDAKQKLLDQVLSDGSHRLVQNLALLLLERGRLHQLPDVVEVFHGLALADRGVAVATVTTAVELNPDEMQLVEQKLRDFTGMQIEVQSKVDPEIIGGIVVQIEDDLLDGSVRTQLASLRHRLAQR